MELTEEQMSMALRLLAALLAGGLIGFERSFRGRPAGFRTHTLVCLSSTMLMLVTVFEWEWIPARSLENVELDPTRMAQGIMTGIGFLGAGVIFKEGISVRGLTTAASIWVTAAIGILIGIGFYFPATLATILTLVVLSVFHWIESRIPTQSYARLEIAFPREAVMDEPKLRAELAAQGFGVANLEYRLTDAGQQYGYRMTIHTMESANFTRLARKLMEDRVIVEFRIAPAGD
jgi:putative Mg2+ transporter-C (MgtC) family protein